MPSEEIKQEEKTEEMKIAELAWAHPNVGEVQHFARHSAIKLRRGVLLMPSLEKIRKTLTLPPSHLENPRMAWAHFTVYPRPEHVAQFKNAAFSIDVGGPAMEHPGAVGTVQILLPRLRNSITISYAQAHFVTGNEPNYVKRRLAEQYGGWRRHAFAQALKLAKEHKLPVLVNCEAIYPHKQRNQSKMSQAHRDLIAACKDAGITKEISKETNGYFTIETN
ncbi:MAG: hypothetical protein V1931_03335 [Candidatus Micrarchaeota archaeon]